MFSKFKKSKAFTIIELLVVIAIIGILAVLILTRLNVARTKARDATRKANLREIQTALEVYADNNNQQYPPATGDWQNMTSLNVLVPDLITAIPNDPLTDRRQYLYRTNLVSEGGAANTRYCLTAALEDTTGVISSLANWVEDPGQKCEGLEPVLCNYYVCN